MKLFYKKKKYLCMTIKQIDEGKENFLIDLWNDNVACEKRGMSLGVDYSPLNFLLLIIH